VSALSRSALIDAPAERVFAYVDDIRNLARHMSERGSMPMMGSKLALVILSRIRDEQMAASDCTWLSSFSPSTDNPVDKPTRQDNGCHPNERDDNRSSATHRLVMRKLRPSAMFRDELGWKELDHGQDAERHDD
jgi:hypothetical protein